jgi:hypothetical protein
LGETKKELERGSRAMSENFEHIMAHLMDEMKQHQWEKDNEKKVGVVTNELRLDFIEILEDTEGFNERLENRLRDLKDQLYKQIAHEFGAEKQQLIERHRFLWNLLYVQLDIPQDTQEVFSLDYETGMVMKENTD